MAPTGEARPRRRFTWRDGFEFFVGMILLVAATLVIQDKLKTRSAASERQSLPGEAISIEGAASFGHSDARVVLIAYADFQCPACRSFANRTLPSLKTRWIDSGQVQFVFDHFPLDSIHPFARTAAVAAECTRRQDLFWQLHDRIYQEGRPLNDQLLRTIITEVGANLERLDACVPEATARVDHDVQEARRYGLTVTPTFFAGYRQPSGRVKVAKRINGAGPTEEFDKILQSLVDGRQ